MKKRRNPVEAVALPLPLEFRQRMRDDLGSESASALLEALDDKPSVSIRLNAAKCRPDTREEIERRAGGSVEWCADGLRFDIRPDFISDPLLHAGVYYVQEAGSMYYQTLLENLLPEIGGDGTLNVLDMCAAPGGKTTAMLNALYRSGRGYKMVANEYERKRVGSLLENLQKWGDPNVVVTNSDSSAIGGMEGMFDIIAVDAPCSGEGMMRREPVARSQWTPELVENCASLQREIVGDLLPALRPGGILIYSTCTFNREENEENAEYFIREYGLEAIGTPRRFMPHECECEGLFAAVFRKKGGERNEGDILRGLEKNKVRVVSVGIMEEERKGNMAVPSSRAVLSWDYDRGERPYAELDLEDAMQYLRGMPIRLPEDIEKGYVAVGFGGYPLGLVKNIGSRANNLYPSEWRVRNR